MKAQAASEYLVLLGAVLMIGLLVIGILAWYPTYGKTDLYWINAKPIAIREAHGYGWWNILVLKNLGRESVTIKGINVSGSTGHPLYYSSSINSSTPSGYSILVYGSYSGGSPPFTQACVAADHSALNCNIPIQPGQTIYVQYRLYFPFPPDSVSDVCGWKNGYLLWNSFSKFAPVQIKIYYSTGSFTQIETSDIKLDVECYDPQYRCSSDSSCQSHYDDAGSSCNVPTGELGGMCNLNYV